MAISSEMMEWQKMLTVDVVRHGTARGDDLDQGSLSSSSSDVFSGSSSLELDSLEEITSPSSSSNSENQSANDPLNDMSSLIQELPIKRGLSNYYQGKSRSFSSFNNVRSLEDLAKLENPYNKRLKTCRSYGGGLGSRTGAGLRSSKCAANTLSRPMCKTRSAFHSRSSCSSVLGVRRNGAGSLMSNRPPMPPQRSTRTSTIPNQTALFA